MTDDVKQLALDMHISEDEAAKILADDYAKQISAKLEQPPKMNRAQRRAWKKKYGKKANEQLGVVAKTATKLNYIDLIQRLRELNEQKAKEIEENETATEDD